MAFEFEADLRELTVAGRKTILGMRNITQEETDFELNSAENDWPYIVQLVITSNKKAGGASLIDKAKKKLA
jgi:hypothetical protein